MKRTRLPLLTLLMCAVLAACNRQAAPTTETLAIDDRNFPDPQLRNYLLAQPYGADSLLTVDEIAAVTSLDLSSLGLTDLTGVQHFTALKDLACVGNSLDTLSLDGLPRLNYLNCSQNRLTVLRLTNLPSLNYLSCGQNSLDTLDLGPLTALHVLDCTDNQLHTLDLTQNTALNSLSCSGNQLNGRAVDALIGSLPQNNTDIHHTIYFNNPRTPAERNACTPPQVAAARAKGWHICHYADGDWRKYDTPSAQ